MVFAMSSGRTIWASMISCAVCVFMAASGFGQEPDSFPDNFTHDEYVALAPHFVVVKVFMKRNEEETKRSSLDYMQSPSFEYFGQDRVFEQFVQNKAPFRTMGIVIAPDMAIVKDMVGDEQYLDYIEVEDWRGGVSRAERTALLNDTPAILLKIADPQKLCVKPVDFTGTPKPLSADTPYYAVSTRYSADRWYLRASRVGTYAMLSTDGAVEMSIDSGMAFAMKSMEMPFMNIAGSFFTLSAPDLLLDNKRTPVGLSLSAPLLLKSGTVPLWLGKEVLASDRVPFETLKSQLEAIKGQFNDELLEIRVAIRQKPKESDTPSFMGGGVPSNIGAFRHGRDTVPKELFFYGLKVGARMLFVPTRIQREHAKLIDTIEVKSGDKVLVGKFAGEYEDIAAFLISVDDDLPGTPVEFSPDKIFPDITPLATVKAEHKTGGKKITTSYTRVTGRMRGYKDKLEPTLLGPQMPSIGAFLTDFSGKVYGVHLEQRHEDEERKQRDDWSFSAALSGMTSRVYTMSELADYISNPAAHLDNTIVALSEDEDSRRMWLGTEFEPMTEELARSMSVEKPTKDGGIGLVVSAIYRNSPAERLGIQPGDILLNIQEPDGDPVELRSEPSYEPDLDFSGIQLPPFVQAMGVKMPERRAWKSCDNILTRLLEVIGEDREAALTYITGQGQEKTVKFVVERSPRDYDSAKKMVDKSLGITVKELTYEVRHALKVPDDQNPVVVAKIEDGMPADVAKVRRYELITKANETDINGVDSFKQVLDAARTQKNQQGKSVLRLTVQNMGNARLADVTLE